MRHVIALILTALFITSCTSQRSKTSTLLKHIDSFIHDKKYIEADSLLRTINYNTLKNDEEKAFYGLLATQNFFMLDKQLNNDSMINFSIAYYKKKNDKKNLARSYYYKGTYYYAIGRIKETLIFFKEAENMEKQANIPELRYLIYANMSYINSTSGAHSTAVTYAKKALALAKKENNIEWICFAYNNIATAFDRMKQRDSAFIYFNKVRPYLNKIKDPKEHATYLNNIGFFYYDKGNYEEAETLFRKADNLISAPTIKINIIKTCYMLNKSQEADSILQATWPKTDHELKAEMLQFLAERAEKQGDFKAAAKYYKQVKEQEDSLKMSQNTEEAITTQQAYDIEKREEETSHRETMAGVIAAIVTAILAAVAIRYHQKKINKAKKAIADNDTTIKELTVKVEELERSDRKHSHEADALRRKIRKLKDEQNEILGRGQRLYDDITAGGNTATWKKKDFDEFIEFYRVSHPEVVADAEDNYKRLSSTNIFYLILTDMGHGDDDAQRIMCMTAGALRTMKSRINGKRKNA